MILPNIHGCHNLTGNFFYFGCDSTYFDLYGKILSNSLKIHAPWASIHAHIFNPTPEQIDWCVKKNVSYSYENVEVSLREIKTYYACVRFIRITEIFLDTARIISLDCDSVAISDMSKEKFIKDTETTKVFFREKGNRSLASTVLFGPDNTRHRYADNLKKYFESNNYEWFLDQTIMDEMISKKEFGITTETYWGTTNPKKKFGTIWTGKGDKKFEDEFQNVLKQYQN